MTLSKLVHVQCDNIMTSVLSLGVKIMAQRKEKYRVSHCCRNCTWECAEAAVGSAAARGSRGLMEWVVRRLQREQSPMGELERVGNNSEAPFSLTQRKS